MTSQHTPGPWKVSQNVTRHVIGPEGGVVACAELTWTNEITEANARLIAAAPELLEALISLERLAGKPLMHAEQARIAASAAIAKATGEKP